ncbi:unnamed protein product [Lactuca virosa]|uniref:Uncharacterized protein n=1 Tax=Lactuca virosa TaxID=75947 RepID=A0AAU9LMJ2_9ASTR|nr:unnamed protein product [Lactuca virosa]
MEVGRRSQELFRRCLSPVKAHPFPPSSLSCFFIPSRSHHLASAAAVIFGKKLEKTSGKIKARNDERTPPPPLHRFSPPASPPQAFLRKQRHRVRVCKFINLNCLSAV